MKKVELKTFIKKFTACALAAAMVLSTPSTAFADEFSDNFPTVYGMDENGSHTDSIDPDKPFGTDTTTINENIGEVTDLIIYGNKKISAKPGKEITLSAALLTNGKLNNTAIATLNKQIEWSLENPIEDAKIVSIRRDVTNPNKCILNPRSAGTVKITAKLTQVEYDENGNKKVGSEGKTFSDFVEVTVREPKKSDFEWKKIDPKKDKFYVKGTYCLSDLLYMNGSPLSSKIGNNKELNSASDVVAFAVKGSSKAATVSGDELTIKKADEEITLLAILPNGDIVEPSLTITTEAGSPVKKLIASESKIPLDFGEKEEKDYKPTADVWVDVETVDGGDTTDEITWTTSNPAIATVDVDPKKPDDQTKAQITAAGDALGKAIITAKSTSGKTAKFSVTVKATLIKLEIVPQGANEYAWSGKTEELIINRVPKQNKDKLKVTSTDKRVKVKSTAGSVMITPVADLKLASDEEKKTGVEGEGENKSEFEYIEVDLTVENADADTKIKVRQSNVRIKKVIDVATIPEPGESDSEETPKSKDMDKQTVKANLGNEFAYTTELYEKNSMPGNDAVSWVSSNTKVATISASGELEVVGTGTAKITASSVYQVSKGKYATSKKTFTVKSTPECETIELKSAVAAYDMSKKKAVTINIKQQLPKKASDEIDWYVNGVKQKKDKKYATDKKLTLQSSAFRNLKAGATVEVMAVARRDELGRPKVYAMATIYVVQSAAKKIAFKTKATSLNVGEVKDILEPTATGSKTDPIVRYAVDKKGLGIVGTETKEVKEVTENGDTKVTKYVTLTGIGEGKATVTAYTASGKKATLKVEVKGGSGSSSSKEDEKETETQPEK